MITKSCDKNCHNCKLAIENTEVAYHDNRSFGDPDIVVTSPYYECPCRGGATPEPSTDTVPCAKCIYAEKITLPYTYPSDVRIEMSRRQRKAISNATFTMECIKCKLEPADSKNYRTPNSRCTKGVESETPVMEVDKVPVKKEDCYVFSIH